MKTILVPTDFGEASLNAISYATIMARVLKGDITLLHIYQTAPALLLKQHKEELLRSDEREKLKKLCSNIEDSLSCRCDYTNVEGAVKSTIVSYTKQLKPDLLIMGTENMEPVEKVLFGTVTGSVIKEVDCTVLVVPESSDFRPPEKIAVAIDYRHGDTEEIRLAALIAKKFKAQLDIIHIVTDDKDVDFEKAYFEDFKSRIKELLPEDNISFSLIEGNEIERELEKYVTDEKINILAVAKSKKSFFERWLVGSVSQNLFNRLHIPLLIFQTEDNGTGLL